MAVRGRRKEAPNDGGGEKEAEAGTVVATVAATVTEIETETWTKIETEAGIGIVKAGETGQGNDTTGAIRLGTGIGAGVRVTAIKSKAIGADQILAAAGAPIGVGMRGEGEVGVETDTTPSLLRAAEAIDRWPK